MRRISCFFTLFSLLALWAPIDVSEVISQFGEQNLKDHTNRDNVSESEQLVSQTSISAIKKMWRADLAHFSQQAVYAHRISPSKVLLDSFIHFDPHCSPSNAIRAPPIG